MINRSYDEKITAWLDKHRDWCVAQLMDLVRIPSVRGEAAPGAPFGVECRRVLDASAQLFERMGFPTRVETERGYAISTWGEGDKTIALMGHADVVPVGDDWIHTQPFEPIIKDGTVIGRGCNDDKAGVISTLCTMMMIRDLQLPVRSRLLGFTGTNEETGMADVQAFVANEPQPDVALIPDGHFPCSVGEKSKLGVWVQCRTPLTAIRDFFGGTNSTTVMGAAEVVLQADAALEQELRANIDGKDTFALRTQEDGTLLLQSFGLPAHAAVNPQDGINAAVLAAELLRGCASLPESDRRIMDTVCDYLGDVYGIGAGIAHDDPRFGKLTMANGLVEVSDGALRLNLDLRYGTEQNTDELITKMNRAWGERNWSMEIITRREGCHVSDNSPYPSVVCDVYREVTGEDAAPFYMAGGTYAHYVKDGLSLGMCADVPGAEPKIVFPEGHGGAHQSDEALDIDGFMLAIRLLTHMVLACDEKLHA